jgi:hypothetical protein
LGKEWRGRELEVGVEVEGLVGEEVEMWKPGVAPEPEEQEGYRGEERRVSPS